MPAVDEEDEAEPVFALLAEAGPGDGAAQQQVIALDASFLADLPLHAGNDVLAGIELAAQAVVLAKMGVIGSAIAVDQQHCAGDQARGRSRAWRGWACIS